MQAPSIRTRIVFILLAGVLAACQKNQQTPQDGAAKSTAAEVVTTEAVPEAMAEVEESVPAEARNQGLLTGPPATTGAGAVAARAVPQEKVAPTAEYEELAMMPAETVPADEQPRAMAKAQAALTKEQEKLARVQQPGSQRAQQRQARAQDEASLQLRLQSAEAPAAAAPSREELRREYLNNLRTASYTFNPPSPIKVDVPKTIHLWVDTMISPEELGAMLKQIVPPGDAAGIVTGQVQVAPEMEARLTGEKFEIRPTSPERQSVNLEGRTIWGWQITPTWPGQYTLHLRLVAILPEAIGTTYTIPEPLDRTIQVEVTLWWLFDHFFEKYWQWLLGGLGTMLAAAFAWWWKKRAAAG
jgi:hypothetical protein